MQLPPDAEAAGGEAFSDDAFVGMASSMRGVGEVLSALKAMALDADSRMQVRSCGRRGSQHRARQRAQRAPRRSARHSAARASARRPRSAAAVHHSRPLKRANPTAVRRMRWGRRLRARLQSVPSRRLRARQPARGWRRQPPATRTTSASS